MVKINVVGWERYDPHGLDHVAGWEPYDLHDLTNVSRVGYFIAQALHKIY